MSTKGQKQEQGQQKQEQKQELPPDPVAEQKQSYHPPENALASDPITEVTTTEEAAKTEPRKE